MPLWEVTAFLLDDKPSVNLAKGQWYIKENNGKYSVVDRQSNSSMIVDQEVFAV